MAIFEQADIVVVPFPFADRKAQKRRPALVVSKPAFQDAHSHIVMAMVTSANNSPWPSDILITDLKSAGLPAPSVVRLKLFTLDERLVLSKTGSLSQKDRKAIWQRLSEVML